MKVSAEFIEGAARLAHAANTAYCEALGDFSHKAWSQLSEEEKQRIMDGVHYVIENPQAGPDSSHANWFNYMIAEGWKYGEHKDPAAKTHPCMMPFDELPQEQQAKDFIFRSIVLEMARIAGYNMVREAAAQVAGDGDV